MLIKFSKISNSPKSFIVGGLFRPASLKRALSGEPGGVSFLVSGASGDEFVIYISSEELAEIALKSNDVLLEVVHGN